MGETSFALVYGTKCMIPAEAEFPGIRRRLLPEREDLNNWILLDDLNLINERQDQPLTPIQNYQQAAAKYYNSNIHDRSPVDSLDPVRLFGPPDPLGPPDPVGLSSPINPLDLVGLFGPPDMVRPPDSVGPSNPVGPPDPDVPLDPCQQSQQLIHRVVLCGFTTLRPIGDRLTNNHPTGTRPTGTSPHYYTTSRLNNILFIRITKSIYL
ncbi:hypothetical protein N665_0246s0019 [Sinapis alba]|nr:hypothetical protein N665_0246s0019 [Sinapis alba]